MVDWDAVACASGYEVDKIPKDLVEIFENIDEVVKDANGMAFEHREDFGVHSAEVIGLIVYLWKTKNYV